MPTSLPETVKAELDRAIHYASSLRVGYVPGGLTDFSRNRKLPLETLLRTVISMQGGSLNKELHDCGLDVSASAFVQQRGKVQSNIFREILLDFNRFHPDPETYRGYHVFAVDGSTVNMARDPSSPCFMCNASNPKGYCQTHINPLYDVLNKTYYDCVLQPQPNMDEIGALIWLLNAHCFPEKTLIVMDRGYESYNMIAHLMLKPNVDFLLRVKDGVGAMREVAKLPMMPLDRDLSMTISTTQTNQDKKNGNILLQVPKRKYKQNATTRAARWDFPSPYPLKFRVVRFMLGTGKFETLVTSLPRSISPNEIKELYHARWGIETSFRQLKYNIGLVNLHSKSVNSVWQEIYASMTIFNFCSRIVRGAVIQNKATNVYEYAVNMKMAMALCRDYFRAPEGDGEKLLLEIAKYTEPVRPNRADVRNLRPKSFPGFTYRVAA